MSTRSSDSALLRGKPLRQQQGKRTHQRRHCFHRFQQQQDGEVDRNNAMRKPLRIAFRGEQQ